MRKLFSMVFSAVLLLIVSGQGTWAQKGKVYDLGTYPYGTWAEAGGINDFGVLVAQGDAADGDNHLFRIELSGSHTGQWFDLGALGAYEEWFTWPLISDTGLVVGYAATSQGYVHGFVWTAKAERTDLGALPSLGRNNSVAVAVNKLGTLVAGYVWGDTPGDDYPVVWTHDVAWNSGRLAATWKIHALETPNGFPYGSVASVNNLGQLAGSVGNDDGIIVAVVWNPVQGGKGWELIELPGSKDWPDVALVGDMNEKGEIVGDVLSPDWIHGYSSLWQPVDSKRRTYKLTLLPNLWGLPQGDTAEGINDLGDIVGASWDENYNFVAVRWTTKDPTSVRSLGFPGDWSLAFKVNELGIATGTYGGGLCANECVAAVQFRPK
jgi:probable HAF family extracellular repeat protein